MTKPTIIRVVLLAALAAAVPARARAQAFATTASQVGFDQRLGEQVPLDVVFRDEAGREAPLGSYFGRRPVVLALVFHSCPLLCNQVLTGLTRSLKPLPLQAGVDFDVLAVSIDPEDTPELAARKKAGYLERYDRPGSESGWHFLTGRKEAIDALCSAVGFRYVYDARKKLYAHAAGVVVLTPGGQAAQYFYGIEYPSKELDGAIRRAASGRIGSRIAKLLLLCYDYDAATGRYTLSIVRLLRVFGTLTALSLGVYLLVMFRRERLGRPGAAATAVPGPGL
jgi:protein SCO1/2